MAAKTAQGVRACQTASRRARSAAAAPEAGAYARRAALQHRASVSERERRYASAVQAQKEAGPARCERKRRKPIASAVQAPHPSLPAPRPCRDSVIATSSASGRACVASCA
jgi:hypothetical protein